LSGPVPAAEIPMPLTNLSDVRPEQHDDGRAADAEREPAKPRSDQIGIDSFDVNAGPIEAGSKSRSKRRRLRRAISAYHGSCDGTNG